MNTVKILIVGVVGVGAFMAYKQLSGAPRRAAAQTRTPTTSRPQQDLNQQPQLWQTVGANALALWSRYSQAQTVAGAAPMPINGWGRSNPLDARDSRAWSYTSAGQTIPTIDNSVLDARDALVLRDYAPEIDMRIDEFSNPFAGV